MARIDSLGNFLTDVAEAIRTKKGTTDIIPASDFDTEIASIESGGGSGNTFTYYANDTSQTPASSIKGINIINNEKDIPAYAYYHNSGTYRNYTKEIIKTVTIGEKTETIGERAFYYGVPVVIPDNNNLKSIGDRCFYYGLFEQNEIKLPNITSIESNAFANTTGLNKIDFGEHLKEIPQNCCSNANIEEVVITNVEKIQKNAFSKTKLTTVDGPNVTYLGESAFSTCTDLTDFNLPNITSVPTNAFYSCTSLTKLSFNKEGFSIGGSCPFGKCTGLTQLSFNGISIGNSSNSSNAILYGCTNLVAVWVKTDTYLSRVAPYTFFNCTGLKRIYIDYPRATVEADKNYATLWSNNTVAEGCIVICNDDEGWITQEAFDAIDWKIELEASA